MDGPVRKVRKSLLLDPWVEDSLDVFQEQLNNAQVSQSDFFFHLRPSDQITCLHLTL